MSLLTLLFVIGICISGMILLIYVTNKRSCSLQKAVEEGIRLQKEKRKRLGELTPNLDKVIYRGFECLVVKNNLLSRTITVRYKDNIATVFYDDSELELENIDLDKFEKFDGNTQYRR